jgi:hypothetical protein
MNHVTRERDLKMTAFVAAVARGEVPGYDDRAADAAEIVAGKGRLADVLKGGSKEERRS